MSRPPPTNHPPTKISYDVIDLIESEDELFHVDSSTVKRAYKVTRCERIVPPKEVIVLDDSDGEEAERKDVERKEAERKARALRELFTPVPTPDPSRKEESESSFVHDRLETVYVSVPPKQPMHESSLDASHRTFDPSYEAPLLIAGLAFLLHDSFRGVFPSDTLEDFRNAYNEVQEVLQPTERAEPNLAFLSQAISTLKSSLLPLISLVKHKVNENANMAYFLGHANLNAIKRQCQSNVSLNLLLLYELSNLSTADAIELLDPVGQPQSVNLMHEANELTDDSDEEPRAGTRSHQRKRVSPSKNRPMTRAQKRLRRNKARVDMEDPRAIARSARRKLGRPMASVYVPVNDRLLFDDHFHPSARQFPRVIGNKSYNIMARASRTQQTEATSRATYEALMLS